jgi:hypothetical protein
MRELVATVLARADRRESEWHGETHWQCVASTGLELAAATPGADPQLALLFGLLHDTRRVNEHVDPGHGPRAAAFARELHGEGLLLGVTGDRLELLARAIERHSDGLVDADPTVAVCWDADRLHLPRVGIVPDPALFSTEVARSDDCARRAAAARAGEVDIGWEALARALARGPILQSYRVAGRFFAGEYPGARDEAVAAKRLALFDDVDVFVDLTDGDDGLAPYEQLLGGFGGSGAAGRPRAQRRVAVPVPDLSVPDEPTLVRALDAIDGALEQGLGVYLHCWGGIGRTGTVVGCWLVRHGASGPAALDRIAELHGATPDGARRSPETEAQREAVLGWSPGR